MSITFAVEVEHIHYALLLNTEKGNEGKIDLTTLADNQKKAVIHVYLFEKGHKTRIKTIELAPLPPKPAGTPRITCKSRLESNRYFHISIVIGKKNLYSAKIDIKPYRKRNNWWWIILIILLLGGGITAGLLLTSDTRQTGRETGLFEKERAPDREAPKPLAEEQATEKSAERSVEDIPESEKETAAESSPVIESEEAPARTVQEATVTEEVGIVYFLPESSVLLDSAKQTLRDIAARIRPENVQITAIEGHCALYGTEESREWLSQERAEMVYSFLTELGVRFSVSPRVEGFGGKKPLTRDRDKQELNRRVELTIETTSFQE